MGRRKKVETKNKMINEVVAITELMVNKDNTINDDRLKNLSVLLALYKVKNGNIKDLSSVENGAGLEFIATANGIYDFLNSNIDKIDYTKINILKAKVFGDNLDYYNDPIIYYKEEEKKEDK